MKVLVSCGEINMNILCSTLNHKYGPVQCIVCLLTAQGYRTKSKWTVTFLLFLDT